MTLLPKQLWFQWNPISKQITFGVIFGPKRAYMSTTSFTILRINHQSCGNVIFIIQVIDTNTLALSHLGIQVIGFAKPRFAEAPKKHQVHATTALIHVISCVCAYLVSFIGLDHYIWVNYHNSLT